MSTTRAFSSNGGLLTKKADAAHARFRLVVQGSDADHVKYVSATTDRPMGITVDGSDAAEDLEAVALLGRGETKKLKMNSTGSKGDLLCPEDPATDAGGKGRKIPATAGAYWKIGRALEDWADEQEIAVEDCLPELVGPQHANGQCGLPAFAADPTGVPCQIWYNDTSKALKAWVNGAAVTIANLLAVFAFVLLGLAMVSAASAADKTAMVQSSAATGKIAAAVLADNVEVPGTFEVTGTTLHTGAVTFTAAPVFTDASGSRSALGLALGSQAQAYDADLAALAGLTSAANAIPYFTGSGTAGVIGSSANMVSLLGSADYNTARTNLGLAISTNVQAYDADLAALAGLTSAANAIPYFTGAGTAGVITSSANVVTFLAAANNAAMADIIGAAFTEGDLADSIIVTADIKDGEIVNADLNASAAIANTKLAYPAVRTIVQAIAVGDFTDNTNTTGYIDIGTQIPTRSIVLGWKFVCTGAFALDTTAVIQVGKSGTVDSFSADVAQSVFGTGTVGSNAKDASSFTTAATTPRVTVTGGADFTTIKTGATGAGTLTIYYVQTE